MNDILNGILDSLYSAGIVYVWGKYETFLSTRPCVQYALSNCATTNTRSVATVGMHNLSRLRHDAVIAK